MNVCGDLVPGEGQIGGADGKARSVATDLGDWPLSRCYQAGYCQKALEAITLRPGSQAPKQNSLVFSFLCLGDKCISHLKKQPQKTDKPNRAGRLGTHILSSRSIEGLTDCLHGNLATFHQRKWVLLDPSLLHNAAPTPSPRQGISNFTGKAIPAKGCKRFLSRFFLGVGAQPTSIDILTPEPGSKQ